MGKDRKMREPTLYQKTVAIAIKIDSLSTYPIDTKPEEVLKKASAEEISFYYERMCKNDVQ